MTRPTGTPKAESGEQRAAGRSSARLAAVQALYQMDIAGISAEAAITEFVERSVGAEQPYGGETPADPGLFGEIVRGAAGRRGEIAELLNATLANGKTLAGLEVILRAILCAGVAELLAGEAPPARVPARVVITEYVDIAHAFYEGAEPGLVNAVLDRAARRVRIDEFDAGSADGGGNDRPG